MNTKKIIILNLLIGIFLGIGLSWYFQKSQTSIDDLITPRLEYTNDEGYVNLINSIGLASFDGAWISDSGDMVNYINAVAIDCWKENNYCVVAQADVIDWFNDGKPTFSNNTDYYDIDLWDEGGIITAYSETGCENQVLVADFVNNTVTLTESSKNNNNQELCSQSKVPSVLRLKSRNISHL